MSATFNENLPSRNKLKNGLAPPICEANGNLRNIHQINENHQATLHSVESNEGNLK